LPIGRDPASEVLLKRTTAEQAEEPQPAWTDVEVLERFPGAAAVSAKPRTGRTHQIRVHLAGIGHPILQDPLYGPEHRPEAWLEEGHGVAPLCDAEGGVVLERQALHAWKLHGTHPATGEPLELVAPPTPDLERTMKWLRGGGLVP
jgi:23S rRNA pseudouridine1911/1915/1917 synthase